MKTITVVTTTRADYGIMKPLISALIKTNRYEVKIVASGTHLREDYGYTYKEIEADGYAIDDKISILENGDSPKDISKTMGNALYRFAEYFSKNRIDALIVLGDRYEILAVCLAAMNERIPIIHLHGGETTEGAIDEGCRHAITKISYLHLAATEAYRKRIIQLGEDPKRVYSVGALGVENSICQKTLSREELEKSLKFDLKIPFAVVTFHPVTLEDNSAEKQCKALLNALDKNKNIHYIITKSNADAGHSVINNLMEEYGRKRRNVCVVESLGLVRYLSALKLSCMVIGNSSSGIIEAPSFGIPTVNIGDRQKGRIQAESVINCKPIASEIDYAIKRAMSTEFIHICKNVKNPYGDGKTSEKMVKAIDEMFENGVDLKKKFYDI